MGKRPPDFVQRLESGLRKGLDIIGIRGKIKAEPIRGTKMYRVTVSSNGFEDMIPGERRDILWRIADKVLFADESFLIASIQPIIPE